MSVCIRCDAFDGFPCLLNGKADAQVCCADPALKAHSNSTLQVGRNYMRHDQSVLMALMRKPNRLAGMASQNAVRSDGAAFHKFLVVERGFAARYESDSIQARACRS
ncbi:MAG TPA: hypothetical protein VGO37_18730 [Steroidobacteraceae bacterium]|nr:hypothetical protein [Steroidobacteraceae bacterium]